MSLIILTGGGTGGHVYPNLALVNEFKRRGLECSYIGGTGESIEKRAAADAGLPFYSVPVIKLTRSMSLSAIKNNLLIPSVLKKGVRAAEEILKKLKPDAVFSKGGFVSLPAVLAASKLNIPVVCHESDLTLGLANKIAKHKKAVMISANPHSTFGKFCGMPLREELFKADRPAARTSFGIADSKKVLLVVGGSSGASILNNLVLEALPKLKENYFVIHITGKKAQTDEFKKSKNYYPLSYCFDMGSAYAAADLIVSRAGATAVSEIAALEKRALFIPLPKGISRGDQIDNAALAVEYGGQVLYQDEASLDSFLESIKRLANSPPMRRISADSNGKIADVVCDSIGRGDLCRKRLQNGS